MKSVIGRKALKDDDIQQNFKLRLTGLVQQGQDAKTLKTFVGLRMSNNKTGCHLYLLLIPHTFITSPENRDKIVQSKGERNSLPAILDSKCVRCEACKKTERQKTELERSLAEIYTTL